MLIRDVLFDDICKIREIYEYYVKNINYVTRVITPSEEDIKEEIRICQKYNLPFLVVEERGEVIGFAYVLPYNRDREIYLHSVRNSIYIDHSHRSSGIGRLLFHDLLNQVKKQKIRSVIAMVCTNNLISIKFHELFGFVKVGTYRDLAYKNDVFLNMDAMQLFFTD